MRRDSSFALKSNGECWGWGENSAGALGDNSISQISSPVSVVGAHLFVQVSGGEDFTLGLKSNGECWAWGLGTTGQLGDNSLTSKSSPLSVVGAHSFVEISAGNAHGMGRKADGTVWCWGTNNLYGQLGDNSLTSKSSPISVVGAHSFVEISGGLNTSHARKADGTAWSWGRGAVGPLGDNSVTDRSSPVSVVGAHSFVMIAPGSGAAYALKANGECWSWGSNASGGQLGDNTETTRSSPVSVVGAHSFVAIAGGSAHCMARKANGEVWCWGNNEFGQVGDGQQ